MLKLYTNTKLLNQENRSYVFPLLFDLVYIEQNNLSEFFQIQDQIKNADIAIWPLDYDFSIRHFDHSFKKFIKEAKKFKKVIWLYTGGDYGYTLKDKNIYTFRLGGFKSKLHKRAIMLPSFINDPYREYINKEFVTLRKKENPSIGFVGHASNDKLKFFREVWHYVQVNFNRVFNRIYADYQSFYPSSIKRYYYLSKLAQSDQIKDNFVLRKKYRAGFKTGHGKQKTTLEFYQNILDNPYTFCMRGNGNFSVRLYETLAMGRIPVFFNTNCKLPLEESINWKDHLVWIDKKDEKRMDQILLAFHKNISENEFEQIQLNNRRLWNESFTRLGFFKHIHDKFINIL